MTEMTRQIAEVRPMLTRWSVRNASQQMAKINSRGGKRPEMYRPVMTNVINDDAFQ